jgi:hypothetical protein
MARQCYGVLLAEIFLTIRPQEWHLVVVVLMGLIWCCQGTTLDLMMGCAVVDGLEKCQQQRARAPEGVCDGRANFVRFFLVFKPVGTCRDCTLVAKRIPSQTCYSE